MGEGVRWLRCVCSYKEPWYKQGQIKPRVPSYCDRLLFHSIELSSCQLCSKNRDDPPPVLRPAQKSAAAPHDAYFSVENHLLTSDHAAVVCWMILDTKHVPAAASDAPRARCLLRLQRLLVLWNNRHDES